VKHLRFDNAKRILELVAGPIEFVEGDVGVLFRHLVARAFRPAAQYRQHVLVLGPDLSGRGELLLPGLGHHVMNRFSNFGAPPAERS
jgi:hypothetical protein